MGYIIRLEYNLMRVVALPTNLPLVVRRPGDTPEDFYPNTGFVSIISGVPFGTMGAWTPIVTPANDIFLSQVVARRQHSFPAAGAVLLELGQGITQIPVDAFRAMEFYVDPTIDDVGFPAIDTEMTWYTQSPAGQSLQGRISEASASDSWDILIAAWTSNIPSFSTINTLPSGAGRYYNTNVGNGISLTTGIMPVYGNWAEVVASAPNDMIVRHLSPLGAPSDVQRNAHAIQIGIGPAGAEIPVSTTLISRGQPISVIQPPVHIKTGERMAVRGSYISAVTMRLLIKVIDV